MEAWSRDVRQEVRDVSQPVVERTMQVRSITSSSVTGSPFASGTMMSQPAPMCSRTASHGDDATVGRRKGRPVMSPVKLDFAGA